jgi:transcriptional antiterminator RfaH
MLPSDMQQGLASKSAWIVVNTHPNRERLAQAHIEKQGFSAYCPMVRRRVRHARRTQEVLRALFPGYTFVAFDPHRDRWRALLSTIGVRTVVRNGERPSLLDGQFVSALRAREFEGAILQSRARYEPGEHVRILGGPFDALIGEVLRHDENGRLQILLQILSSKVRTQISDSCVERANQNVGMPDER